MAMPGACPQGPGLPQRGVPSCSCLAARADVPGSDSSRPPPEWGWSPFICSMEGGSMSSVPTAKALVRVHIRWMIRRDMPEVLAIEHASFDFPWGEEEFLRVLRQRNCIGMVAEHGERVVGFMIYELHKSKLQ